MPAAPQMTDRFRRDLDALIAPSEPIGIAVSGGPDSLALLVLASASRPGLIEAATVDHALRTESAAEAAMVARVCEQLQVPHAILKVQWPARPATAVQERARIERYDLLAKWASERGLRALVTAHHLDDQAETLLMRLARGSGARGLAGMRPVATAPGHAMPLLRPLLGWKRSELAEVCALCGLSPIADPSNVDLQFERVRVRAGIAESDWLNAEALAHSAANLADADAALDWAAARAWDCLVTAQNGRISYRPSAAPREIHRRIVGRAITELAREGAAQPLRGREIDHLLSVLEEGGRATLRGVLCQGGPRWDFVPAPVRTGRVRAHD